MESTLMNILINSVAGGGGGFLANLLKKNNLSMIANLLAGVVGGNAGAWIASAAGLLANADGSGNMLMSIISAVLGGGAGFLIGGFLGGKKPAS
ncbi:MAG: hypothetical protein IPN29_19095 [Saprospiraceae bacterium]|nr:hypothetical protein [Saprospiraceae bacterium]